MWVAVTQEVERAVHYTEGWWFDPQHLCLYSEVSLVKILNYKFPDSVRMV